jgi:hypothetical protein
MQMHLLQRMENKRAEASPLDEDEGKSPSEFDLRTKALPLGWFHPDRPLIIDLQKWQVL